MSNKKTVFLIGFDTNNKEKLCQQMTILEFIMTVYNDYNTENIVHNVLEFMYTIINKKVLSQHNEIKHKICNTLVSICKDKHIGVIFDEYFLTIGLLKSHLLNIVSNNSIYIGVINEIFSNNLLNLEIKDILKDFLSNPNIKTKSSYTNDELYTANLLIELSEKN